MEFSETQGRRTILLERMRSVIELGDKMVIHDEMKNLMVLDSELRKEILEMLTQ
jgi:hypothetical protein